MNPLHAEGWFALGFCALKTADTARAAQAFTRAAQQDPDNGEAWNNLAAVHLKVRGCSAFWKTSLCGDAAAPQLKTLSLDGWKDGWKDGWMEGWMDGRMDGRMDGWKDGWKVDMQFSCAFPCSIRMT